MIYLVTKQQDLFQSSVYEILSIEKSLELLRECCILQADTETTGTNPHIDRLLTVQLGNDEKDIRIVIDCTTIDIRRYKTLLESTPLIFHNGKFDLQFLYNYKIIPRKIYDTMIVEQLLYLGYPAGQHSYSLQAIAKDRLDIYIDKSVRSQIPDRGIDETVVKYAANDVVYLEKIMNNQLEECKLKDCVKGMHLECNSVPFMAYLEWCGIKLDENKWKAKMQEDEKELKEATNNLNQWFIHEAETAHPEFKKHIFIDTQGDLFSGYNLEPQVTINWSSSQQVVTVAKALGFNTVVQDKKTGEDKNSVLEKHLKSQKGICDEFLTLYFGKGDPEDDDYYIGYNGAKKVCTSFGQGHLNIINPKTGRIHTNYHQLGASSGRMSCGSGIDKSLAKIKKLDPQQCKMLNMQQLPSNKRTRSCFVSEPNNVWVSCDFSAEEARLAGDIYQDKAILDIFLKGIDSHSMYAKIFFKDELANIDVNEVKKKRPDLRQKAKGPEFALNFGGGVPAIMQALNCTEEEALLIVKNYEEGFKGTSEFAKKGSKFVRQNGYVLINPLTGHKMYWWDWAYWKQEEQDFQEPGFWDRYKEAKANDSNPMLLTRVRNHFKAASKYDRMARNSPCQGTAAIILKDSQIEVFNWVVNNGYFGKILLVNLTHDEANWECPKGLINIFPDLLQKTMEKSASKYCKSLPIPASKEVSDHWVH